MLRDDNTVAWLTPHAAVVRANGRAEQSCGRLFGGSHRFCFNADGIDMVARARSSEHLLEICDVVLRLLAASVVQSLILNKERSRDRMLLSAPTLAHLMEQCESLKVLTLTNLIIDENHCRVLGAYSRPDFEINLYRSTLTSAGTSALAEVLGRNQGPTKLAYCDIDYSILTDGLRGKIRLKLIRALISNSGSVSNEELLAIAGALKENKGLVDVDLAYNVKMSEETWEAVLDSLKTHPTLQVFNLNPIRVRAFQGTPIAPAVLKSRIQALLNMLKVNLSIHTLRLHDHYSQHELFGELINPYLETNRLRPRLLAIQRTRPITYRAKVLGRALLSARTDANRYWMLLSGNAEIAFPSATATATLAASISTPATVCTSVNAATGAANPVATDRVPATSVAALAPSQKRKASP